LKKVIGIAAIILASALAMPAYGQADPNTHTAADAAMDILACSAVSEGLGTYEDFNTEQKIYSDERCDYLMQYYNLVCESFGSGADYCTQGSFSYVKMQSYIAREGLQQNVGPTVIEKTVKVEIEEEDDDEHDDDDKDRDHHYKHRHDKHKDRHHHRDDLPNCNDVEYGTHCDGSEDEDSWLDEDDKEQDKDSDRGNDDDMAEEEDDNTDEEEQDEPKIKPFN
jgi:hypothetical protein